MPNYTENWSSIHIRNILQNKEYLFWDVPIIDGFGDSFLITDKRNALFRIARYGIAPFDTYRLQDQLFYKKIQN